MQEDVTFKVKVESGGFKATQIAIQKQSIEDLLNETPLGISHKRLERFKKAFAAKWLKEQLETDQKPTMEG